MPPRLSPPTVTLSDVCFCHWPVDAAVVAGVVPDWLSVDRRDGTAWVSAVATAMSGWEALNVDVGRTAEAVNCRTYVRTPGGDRAVYFLSLDATDPLAVETARRLFRLPYHRATVERTAREERTRVECVRRESRSSPGSGSPTFAVEYESVGEPTAAEPDTLAAFLVERYRYAVEGPLGTRLVGGVGHDPWALRPAEVTVEDASLVEAALGDERLDDATPAVAHASPGTELRVGLPGPASLASRARPDRRRSQR